MGTIHKAAAAAVFAVALAGAAGAAVQDGAPVFKKNLFGDFARPQHPARHPDQ